MGVAAQAAAAEGLEVWFSPFPVEVPAAGLISLFRDCATLLSEGPGHGYQGLGWRPRLSFEAMAALPVS